MRRNHKSICLSRETLRHLAGIDDSQRPPGTYPDTQLPDNCHTASCGKPGLC